MKPSSDKTTFQTLIRRSPWVSDGVVHLLDFSTSSASLLFFHPLDDSVAGATLKRKLCGEGYYEGLLKDCRQLEAEQSVFVAPRSRGREVSGFVPAVREEQPKSPQNFADAMSGERDTSDERKSSSHAQPNSGRDGYSTSYTVDSGQARRFRSPMDKFSYARVTAPASLSRSIPIDEGDNRKSVAFNESNMQDHGSQARLRAWQEIEADLDRVFINGRTRVNTPGGKASLRRVLRAYSLRNPAVGYCQGMNFIVGLLLQVRSG